MSRAWVSGTGESVPCLRGKGLPRPPPERREPGAGSGRGCRPGGPGRGARHPAPALRRHRPQTQARWGHTRPSNGHPSRGAATAGLSHRRQEDPSTGTGRLCL